MKRRHPRRLVRLFCLILWGVSVCAPSSFGENVYRTKFESDGKYLLVELLDDGLAHFELSATSPFPTGEEPIETTPMVARTDYPGPRSLSRPGGPESNVLETKSLRIEVNPTTLCLSYRDKTKGGFLTQVCPLNLKEHWKGITFSRGKIQNIYGLGQEFQNPGLADGDWMGRIRKYGGLHGNKMVHFNGGDSGNTQIPILFALGEGKLSYGLFLDQIYQQEWNFKSDPMKVEMYGDHIRWYFLAGSNLADLRKKYLDLTGRPPVPPKPMFGLWVSEFGYRNWAQLEGKLGSLRGNEFPVDGFLLDLFWFGGIVEKSDDTKMGQVSWDLGKFPSPREKLRSLRDEQGVGVIPIEESYVGKNLSEHEALASRGYLVNDDTGETAYLKSHWWGNGGMMDWTNAEGADYWHRAKRVPLVEAGVAGHWLDLGEPEIFPENARYCGGRKQADAHNIYNLKWAESVYQGYEQYLPEKRPFLLSRSGTGGIQRYGVSMWSGDIGANLDNLAAHQNNQMHMSLSGVDYYGSDIGGFHRTALQGDLNEMYTQWLAYGALFDVPARPHTLNLCQCNETSPDRIGDFKSNRENLRWRYRLVPYTYSLAHLAYREGDPVFPPPLYYFQEDPNLRRMGREKMIGPWLLALVAARHGQTTTSVYLPEGRWVDFYSGRNVRSAGQSIHRVSLYPDGYFRLPLYLRAGALIPLMFVDEKTMNVSGKRKDGSRRDELMLKVVLDAAPSRFTLFEDDGLSTGYLKGQVRETLLSQSLSSRRGLVTIAKSSGDYAGAISSRNNVVELIHEPNTVEEAHLNQTALPQLSTKEEWYAASRGWFAESNTRTWVKTGVASVSDEKTVEVVFKKAFGER